ncbi:MAG: hypothetical protein GKR96_04360 [Gammaproteobacteria bacterium]|nr:hypothetical protein [Gammaproteobacteria bacterium]
MDGTLQHLIPLFELMDEFEETMRRNTITFFAPGIFTIGGVFLLHFGIGMSMAIFYSSILVGLGNTVWPLIKHQQLLAETSPKLIPEKDEDTDL